MNAENAEIAGARKVDELLCFVGPDVLFEQELQGIRKCLEQAQQPATLGPGRV